MSKYDAIHNLLISIFSVDIGLDEAEETAALSRVLNDPLQKKEIEKQLRALFEDPNVSWVNLLDNNDYTVYPADDDEDAKEFVIDILWNKVFPNEPK